MPEALKKFTNRSKWKCRS